MVGNKTLQDLSLDELTGVVNIYPWYGGARLELCRRMATVGGWTREQFAREALYVADRAKIGKLALSAPAEPKAQEQTASMISPTRKVHVVGGDYFSQADYDSARRSGDPVVKKSTEPVISSEVEKSHKPDATSDIADRFCTEALAEIFAEQGFTQEALRIYSRLVLEFPEKSAYFAALIEKLEKEQI